MAENNKIDSFGKVDWKIKNAAGKPLVLEALWDGDTNGWYVYLTLYTTTKILFWKKVHSHYIGTITLGGDLRLFNGQVPPWPEAELAKEIGQKAKEKYNLIFYFPSEEPNDDCPKWTERHLAINCSDCKKLIIPTQSPYLPKDLCYNCHIKRKYSEK